MDFTIVHPHWFLLAFVLLFFPRLSTLSMLIFGSLMLPQEGSYQALWILGWLLTPRLLIAILSMAYFTTNPILVVFAWIFAFVGESSEKKVIIHSRNSK